MKLKNKGNKGITLVALVITIIILIILAGISIASLSGENGLLGKTIKAAEEHNKSAAKEALSLKLSAILLDKNGDKDLSYLNDMTIEGYNVEVSNIGRIVTMTKDKKSYQFFIDSEYNVTELGEVSATTGSGSSGQSQGEVKDYTDNLLYKVNFKELLESTDEKITKVGTETGIEVDETNTYATFDGASGIVVDESIIEGLKENYTIKGTTTKTMTLWYRTKNESYPDENFLVSLGAPNGPLEGSGVGCGILFQLNQLNFGVGGINGSLFVPLAKAFDKSWHFMVGIFEEGNTIRGYVDNVEFSKKTNWNTKGSAFSIGFYCKNIPYYYEGDLADVRIYSSALSDEQVNQLYQYGKQNLKGK